VRFTVTLRDLTTEAFGGFARAAFARGVAAALGVPRARVALGAAHAGSVVVDAAVRAAGAADAVALTAKVRRSSRDGAAFVKSTTRGACGAHGKAPLKSFYNTKTRTSRSDY
jgi:hypothetical protein